MRIDETIEKLKRTIGSGPNPISSSLGDEFELTFLEDKVKLSTEEWVSAKMAGYGEDCSCKHVAYLSREAVNAALKRLLRDGESEVYDVVTWHTHAYGRDEVGRYDNEYDTANRHVGVRFKVNGSEIEWTPFHGQPRTDSALLENIYENKQEIGASASVLMSVGVELKKYLARYPHRLRDLTPRNFEELVADILKDFGFDVELTRATHDGGVDIYAYIKTQVCAFLMYVECKKWAEDRPVGLEVVQRLYGVQQAHKANKSMIVTTSYFTRPAVEESRRYDLLMTLTDFTDLKNWLKRYESTV